MTTKLTPDQAMDALAALKPGTDDLTTGWYLGRSEQNLQAVLAQTSTPAPAARPSRTRWVVAAAVAAALVAIALVVVSGVVGPGRLTAIPVHSPATAPVATATRLVEPRSRWATAALAPDDMPLVPYLAALKKVKDDEASRADTDARRSWWNRREAFLAQCMAGQGYTYFPRDYDGSGSGYDSEAAVRTAQRYRDTLPIPALDPERAVVASVGYGLSSTPEQQLSRLTRVDLRNAEYWSSLSPQQQDGYDVAMSGQPNDDTRINPMTSGCYWAGERKFPEVEDHSVKDQIWSRFIDIIPALLNFTEDASIEADPQIVTLNNEWRACMTGAGHSTEAIRAHQTGRTGGFDGPRAAIELASLTGDDGAVADYPAPSDAPADQQSLTGAEPEIRIALADYDCRRATNYVPRLVAVQRSIEEQFVRAHQKRLDQLLASANE